MTSSSDQAISLRQHLSNRWSPQKVPVLVIGDSMLDIYVYGSVDRISPEAPVPVIKQTSTRAVAGGAANVAANIVGMGGACHLISCVGDDADGVALADILTASSVTVDFVKVAKPTTTKTRFTAGQHQLLRVDREDPTAVAGSEQAILAAIEGRIDQCRLLVVSDYDKGALTKRVLRHAISMAKARGTPVLVDPKRRDFSAYHGASLVKPNRSELATATGLPVITDEDVDRAAGVAAQLTGADILVTRSEAGMSLVKFDGAAIHMPTHAHQVFDVTGAGDTVMAALALGLACGRSIEEAMAFANLAGGLAVSKPGTAVVMLDELEAERARVAEEQVFEKGQRLTHDAAIRLANTWKGQGLVVGFTNGCFDILHPGHIALLRGAARACDRLIVGLNGVASVRRLKGPGRPAQTVEARAAILGAIDQVSAVVVFDDDTPSALIAALVPDVLVKGADYRAEDIVGSDTVRTAGGRVITVELVPGHSTTGLIERAKWPVG